MTTWRYSINYGPDGEANYANVHAADGQFVGNLRTHHAIAICNAFAVCDKLASIPSGETGAQGWDGDVGQEERYLLNLLEDDRLTAEDLHRAMNRIRYRQLSGVPRPAVTTTMVNAAWNEAKDRRMTGLPTDFRAVLEAALSASQSLENGPAGLADATTNPASSDLSSLRKGAEVVGEAAAYDFVADWHGRQAKLFREMAEDDPRTAEPQRKRAFEAAIHHAASAAALRNRAADDRRAALVSGSRGEG